MDGLTLPTCTLEELKENFLKLKAERENLQAERLALAQKPLHDASVGEDSVLLRLRLSETLARFNSRVKQLPSHESPSLSDKAPPFPSAPGKSPLETEKSTGQPLPGGKDESPDSERPLDPLALAHVLFKAENFAAALRAYRLIDLRGTRAEERLPIQYLIATCLKRLGKTEEAAGMYREIANSRGDENLAACAQWQLGAMRWEVEMRGQLETIRQRRKSMENRP